MIILLFGQPASGKTTLANKLILMPNVFYSFQNFMLIDGDKWREVTKNKNYSREGRLANMKGAFDMALYLENEGFIPVLSFVTPYEEMREYLSKNAKQLCLIYLQYDENRGRNSYFANDFEEPKIDCLKLDTSSYDIQDCLTQIINYITIKYEDT